MDKRSDSDITDIKALGQGISDHLNASEESEKSERKRRTKRRQDISPRIKKDVNVVPLEDMKIEPVDYDHKEVEEFLQVVFHSDLIEDENILGFYETKQHSKPITEELLLDILERTRKAARLYTATATVGTDQELDRPLNRKNLFKRYYVLVLDDIGTKIPFSKIPDDFEPTYKLETSPGNYQYGYVLDEPIDDYEVARALVTLVYSSGYTDEGGNLVNKKVRLPQGIHGKPGENIMFRTRLAEFSKRLWRPQDILETLGISHSWDAILENAEDVRRRTRVSGVTPWAAVDTAHATLDGIVDPVVEWLHSQDMILDTSGEFFKIRCPWADLHTPDEKDPKDYESAYYSPIGIGDDIYKTCRGFNCFHSHDHSTQDFLDFVAMNDGPQVPIKDPAAALASSHVYDCANNTVWDVKSALLPFRYKNVEAFKQVHNKRHKSTTLQYDDDGREKIKHKLVPEWQLYEYNPARVIVHGTALDPSTTAKLVEYDSRLYVNEFSMPDYGHGRYDQKHVDTFKNYIEYLIPNEEESALFIQWLAAKMQNMAFRGWGILMIAKAFGIGRGTLEAMLSLLYGEHNCANVPFDKLIGGSAENKYNEWQAKPLAFTSEIQEVGGTRHDFYHSYNALKEVVDTTIKTVEINNKYGLKQIVKTYTSHLIMSNHEAAAAVPREDRRLYVIENATVPASQKYFTMINEWMEQKDPDTGLPAFTKHVARWLRSIDVDWSLMNGPAPMTAAKDDMVTATKSAIDIAYDALLNQLPSQYVYPRFIERVLKAPTIAMRLNVDDDKISRIIKTKTNDTTTALFKNYTVIINGSKVRARVKAAEANDPTCRRLRSGTATPEDKAHLKDQLALLDEKEMTKIVSEAMTIEGY